MQVPNSQEKIMKKVVIFF